MLGKPRSGNEIAGAWSHGSSGSSRFTRSISHDGSYGFQSVLVENDRSGVIAPKTAVRDAMIDELPPTVFISSAIASSLRAGICSETTRRESDKQRQASRAALCRAGDEA